MNIFVPKPLGFWKLCHSSEMQNDNLMHREVNAQPRYMIHYVKSTIYFCLSFVSTNDSSFELHDYGHFNIIGVS